TQIELVDLAVVIQAASAVAAVIGVARDGVAEGQYRDPAALADRAVPPVGAAPRDQSMEIASRDHALIGGPPRVIMRVRDGLRIGRSRATNLYQDSAHVTIQANHRVTLQVRR